MGVLRQWTPNPLLAVNQLQTELSRKVKELQEVQKRNADLSQLLEDEKPNIKLTYYQTLKELRVQVKTLQTETEQAQWRADELSRRAEAAEWTAQTAAKLREEAEKEREQAVQERDTLFKILQNYRGQNGVIDLKIRRMAERTCDRTVQTYVRSCMSCVREGNVAAVLQGSERCPHSGYVHVFNGLQKGFDKNLFRQKHRGVSGQPGRREHDPAAVPPVVLDPLGAGEQSARRYRLGAGDQLSAGEQSARRYRLGAGDQLGAGEQSARRYRFGAGDQLGAGEQSARRDRLGAGDQLGAGEQSARRDPVQLPRDEHAQHGYDPVPYESRAAAPVPYESRAAAPAVPYESRAAAPVPHESRAAAPVPYESRAAAPVPHESRAAAPVPYESRAAAQARTAERLSWGQDWARVDRPMPQTGNMADNRSHRALRHGMTGYRHGHSGTAGPALRHGRTGYRHGHSGTAGQALRHRMTGYRHRHSGTAGPTLRHDMTGTPARHDRHSSTT
ncbi:Hypp1534 [Branchiostoma lanceolatum]|uniref:Hypp1534 protein n=1 Tax=Branchiostoma lanceolatum TaxID=7740 RepID=A0A8K0ELB6_BRALA|nr:Hypp1534 [Branchiostoma lanceolatum]